MQIMTFRYQQLLDAVRGYQQTGIPLVGSRGGHFYPAGFSDDTGIYYFIPKLVSGLGISLDQAITVFFGGTAFLQFLIGLIGIFILHRQANQRLISLVILSAVSALALQAGDVYSVSFFFAVASVPWAIYAVGRMEKGLASFLILPVISFLAPVANSIRSHSGTGIAIFCVSLLFFSKAKTHGKILVVLLMVLSALGPTLFMERKIHERNAYLQQVGPDAQTKEGGHPFWHSFYIGLGFIDNPHVEKYLDEVAMEKVKSIDPGVPYLSREYADILTRESMKIIRSDPGFFIRNLSAKAGVIALYCLLFINIGIFAAYSFRKPFPLDLVFFIGMFLNSLYGFVAVPYTNYLLGLIAFATLYSIISINYALENRTLLDVLKKIRNSGHAPCAGL